jgi:hypothetical protein
MAELEVSWQGFTMISRATTLSGVARLAEDNTTLNSTIMRSMNNGTTKV